MGKLFAIFLIAGLGVLEGCGSTEVKDEPHGPVSPPRVAVRVRYQLGGPLHGAVAAGHSLPKGALSAARALELDVTLVALAGKPAWELASVSSQSRVVMAEGDAGDTILATPRALEEGRAGLLDGSPGTLADQAASDLVGRGTKLASVRACLVQGATAVVELVRDEPPARTGEPRRERACVLLGRRLDGKGVDAAIEHEGEPGPPEIVELTAPVFEKLPAPSSWVALVPSPFAGEEARWLAFIVHAARPPVPPDPLAGEHEDAVAAAARDLIAQQQTSGLATIPPAPPPAVPDIEATRRALWDRPSARRGLYALATATRAKTAEALSVLADDHTLAPIASALAVALGSAPVTGKPDELGIYVEQATLVACLKALVNEPVPNDLVAALEWRGGAALKLLPSLMPEIEKARTLRELEALIVSLNVRLLLDASPAVRARASRWLSARMPLEGYSPLASSAERRAAVEKIKKRAEVPGDDR